MIITLLQLIKEVKILRDINLSLKSIYEVNVSEGQDDDEN